jgi:hypothetical protein
MAQFQGTVDGQTIFGFADGDDAVQVEHIENIGSLIVGADGATLFSQMASKAARIRIRLLHTSPTHELLLEKQRNQRNNILDGFPVDFVETASGEGGTADKCFIEVGAMFQYGKNGTPREWVLVTGDFEPKIPNNS